MDLDKDERIYNYAFSLNNSPFGEVYYKSILSKLDTNSTDGVFITSVLLWSIIELKHERITLYDSISVLRGLDQVNGKPNLEYMFEKYSKGWGNILLKNAENFALNAVKDKVGTTSGSWTEVSEDGWLKVSTNQSEKVVVEKIEKNVVAYTELAQNSKYSTYRIAYLLRTIEALKRHGRVYLVRLPIHAKLFRLEKEFDSNFEESIKEAVSMCSGYLDYSEDSDEYTYTDGNHLTVFSSEKISRQIAEDIGKLDF